MDTLIWSALVLSVGINLVMFLPAFYFKTDKLTDISYAVTFAVLALFGVVQGNTSTSRLILFAMISVWALRLGGFLLYRVWQKGKDSRFDEMREHFWKFGRFWLLQGVTVWVVMLSAILAFSEESMSANVLSIIGLAIWATGLVIETVADWQKFKFSQNPKNEGTWIDEGIWQYSRHPNYFGEMSVWIGVYLFCLANLSGYQVWLGLLSPLYIIGLLLFVSGVPILEKSADKKWGDDKKYQQYKKRTSILIPLPKKN